MASDLHQETPVAHAAGGPAAGARGAAEPGSAGPGGMAPGGTAPGGAVPGGTAPGGTTPGGMAPLDPGVLHVIRSSAGRLTGLEGAFIRQLHADVASLITVPVGNLWGVCERMVQCVLWVPATDQPPDVIAGTLRRVGAMNQAEGFPETQYVSMAHALVRAVRDLSGNSWSTSTGSAWISYFLWLRPHLIAGARQATAQQAAAEHEAARQAAARLEAARQAAAQLEAARAQAAAQNWLGRPAPPTPEVDLETAATLLDDDDDDDQDAGYGQIMVSMTRNKRGHPHHPD